MKTVLLGDIGAQYGVMLDMLKRVGMGPDLMVPDGLTIIQVGDVVRMANDSHLDSYACAKLSDEILRKNPGRWIQLLGNHESSFIGGPYPEYWVERSAFHDCHDIISGWWNEDLVKLAVGFELDDGEYVLSHAGITHGYTEHVGLTDAKSLVSHINGIVGTDYGKVARTGIVNFFDEPNMSSDFLWASSGGELIPSWEGKEMQFHQIHGHDTPLLSWETPELRDDLPDGWSIDIDAAKRLSVITTPQERRIMTTDWVLKETESPDTNTWGLVQIDGAPSF